MSWLPKRLRGASPADMLLMDYVGFTGLLVLCMGWRLDAPLLWVALVIAHAAILGVTCWLSTNPRPTSGVRGFGRDVYPLIHVTFLYWEIRLLALFFSTGYHDASILTLEEGLFGEQLAMTLSERWPWMWLSEFLHFCYASYWLMVPVACIALHVRGRADGLRELVFALLFVFFTCYLVFIFYPVQGPYFEFPRLGEPWSRGAGYRFVHAVLHDGASQGAAFPSSHVAIAFTILPVAWRHDRAIFWAFLVPVVGLAVSTVYGRIHYATDAVCGALLMLILFPLALRLRAWLQERIAGQS